MVASLWLWTEKDMWTRKHLQTSARKYGTRLDCLLTAQWADAQYGRLWQRNKRYDRKSQVRHWWHTSMRFKTRKLKNGRKRKEERSTNKPLSSASDNLQTNTSYKIGELCTPRCLVASMTIFVSAKTIMKSEPSLLPNSIGSSLGKWPDSWAVL